MAKAVVGVVGQKKMKRQVEKTMERRPTHVDGSNACRGEHNVFLACMLTDIFDEGRLSSTRLSGEEKTLISKLHEIERVLEFFVVWV